MILNQIAFLRILAVIDCAFFVGSKIVVTMPASQFDFVRENFIGLFLVSTPIGRGRYRRILSISRTFNHASDQ
jgi:hypothetical protein